MYGYDFLDSSGIIGYKIVFAHYSLLRACILSVVRVVFQNMCAGLSVIADMKREDLLAVLVGSMVNDRMW